MDSLQADLRTAKSRGGLVTGGTGREEEVAVEESLAWASEAGVRSGGVGARGGCGASHAPAQAAKRVESVVNAQCRLCARHPLSFARPPQGAKQTAATRGASMGQMWSPGARVASRRTVPAAAECPC